MSGSWLSAQLDYVHFGISLACFLLAVVAAAFFVFLCRRRLSLEQQIAERTAALQESEAVQRLLMDSLGVGIAIINPRTRVIERVNPMTAELFGRPSEEIVGKVCHNFLCPNQIGTCPVVDCGLVAENSDRVMLRADGSRVPVLKSVKRIIIGGEEKLLETLIDIRHRKQTEEELRASEARLHSITDSAQDAILMIDPQGSISYWNPAAESIFGYRSEEVIGKNLHALLVPARYLDAHHAAFPEFCRTGRGNAVGKTVELEARRKDGQEIAVSLALSAVSLSGAWHAVGILRDVTERKRSEDELLHAKAALQEYAAVLESANQALEESNRLAESAARAKSEFLANMSHEIRTPMTAILGFAQILINEPSLDKAPPKRIEALRTIERNGQHLMAIINDILDLSKIEAGKFEVEQIACSPSGILGEVVSLMSVRAEAKSLPLQIEYAGAIPRTITTDPTRLRQVLVNLVGNAIKFTDSGAVRITTRMREGADATPCLVFDVADTGIGIAPAQLDKLFQPFCQADPSTSRKFGGTGLGLAICKRLANMLGGEVCVDSVVGKGSTFTLTIPTGSLAGVELIENPGDILERSAVGSVKTSSQPSSQNCRVLLAEDTPDIQGLISALLKSAGADVTAVDNGRLAADAALAAAGDGKQYDLILMDMQMPVMDGYAATRLLRAEGYDGRIVALTAHSMVGNREECLAAGCDDYLTKPIVLDRLFAVVAASARISPVVPSAAPAEVVPDTEAVLRSEYVEHPIIGRMLGDFVATLDDRIQLMYAAMSSENSGELRRLAHQLKGVAGSYGYPSLSIAARALEDKLHVSSWDEAANVLNQIAELSQAALRGWRAPSTAPAADSANSAATT